MLHNVKLKIHLPNTEGANVLIRAVQLGRADLVTAILFLFGKNALVVNFKDGVRKKVSIRSNRPAKASLANWRVFVFA